MESRIVEVVGLEHMVFLEVNRIAAEHIVAVAEEHIAVGNVVVVDTALCSWERIAPQAYRL